MSKSAFRALERGLKAISVNSIGDTVDGKLVVFESDDWGSIRTSSKENFPAFRRLSSCEPYLDYDSMASQEDLSALFDVLQSFSDNVGSRPVFTANTVMANPDFDRIRESGFSEYFYEPFYATLEKYYPNEDTFDIWKEGISNNLFWPQFHGREHVNVPIWLSSLSAGNRVMRRLFDLGSWSVQGGVVPGSKVRLQACLDYEGSLPYNYQRAFINDGLSLFKDIFGYFSKSVIANNYIWSPDIHEFLVMNNVELLQSMKYQIFPFSNVGKHTLSRRYFGQELDGLKFSVRNCAFEPSLYPISYDIVSNCLKEMSVAFALKKPAIIVTHRLNYIGAHSELNRNRNLDLLRDLLGRALRKWPDLKFVRSTDLLNQMQ